MKYQVRFCKLNASHFGDPQNRRRVILFVACHDVKLPSQPEPTHGCSEVELVPLGGSKSSGSSYLVPSKNLLPIRTVKDVIGAFEDHPAASSGSGIIDCNGILIHNHKSSNKSKHSDKSKVLPADEPAATVICSSQPPLHYRHTRCASVRELACIQSFPPSFQFFGSLPEQYKQVGNAVPCCLATAVAKAVAAVHGLPT